MTAPSSTSEHTEVVNHANEPSIGTATTREDTNRPDAEDAVLTEQQASRENKKLAEHMHYILADNRQEAGRLRRKLSLTYWIVVTLSVLMFLVGLALISTPLWDVVGWVNLDETNGLPTESLVVSGIGIADLIGLVLFNPIARVQKLMGDMSQLTVLFDGFQTQVALRLLETDSKKRETMGIAASHVGAAADDTCGLIEERYEKWLIEELRRSGVRRDGSDGTSTETNGSF